MQRLKKKPNIFKNCYIFFSIVTVLLFYLHNDNPSNQLYIVGMKVTLGGMFILSIGTLFITAFRNFFFTKSFALEPIMIIYYPFNVMVVCVFLIHPLYEHIKYGFWIDTTRVSVGFVVLVIGTIHLMDNFLSPD